jgi:hypothetical protein
MFPPLALRSRRLGAARPRVRARARLSAYRARLVAIERRDASRRDDLCRRGAPTIGDRNCGQRATIARTPRRTARRTRGARDG